MRSHAKAATAGSNLRQARGFAAALGAVLLLALLAASVAGAEPMKQLAGFGPDGTEASDFERIGSIAVDQQEGSVYVLDASGDALYKFDPEGNPVDFGGSAPNIEDNRIAGLDLIDPSTTSGSNSQVAVDASTHVIYVTEEDRLRAFQANGEPANFTAGPGAGTNEIPGFTELFGVAVDGNGDIYTSDHVGTVSVFTPPGELLKSFSAVAPFTVSVDSSGAVYTLQEKKAIKKFTPSEFPVSASTTYTETTFVTSGFFFFTGFSIDPVTHDAFVLESNFTKTWIYLYDASGALIESIGEPGTPREDEFLGGQSEGVAVLATGYEAQPKEFFKFYVGDSDGEDTSKVAIFGEKTTVDRPSLSDLRVTSLTADSVRFHASVNPNTKPTTYRFEYGLEDCSVSICASVPVGGASVGEGSVPVAVAHTATGLVAGTTYHYRLIAENELGESEVAGTFTTQSLAGGSALSDARVWEMVSPPNKHGGVLVGSIFGLVQAAESGDGIAYLSRGSTEPDPEGNRSLEASAILSKRGAGGWASKDISPANSRTIPIGIASRGEYKLFTPELGSALIEPHDGTQLSPDATDRTPYLRENAEPPSYTPLVTGKEGVANVPPGTVFGGNPALPVGSVSIVGANVSLSDVVLASEVPLAVGAPANALYHWRAGELQSLSVLPDAEGGGVVNAELLGSRAGSVQHAISEDGSRIFWGRGQYGGGAMPTALYLRDTEAAETVRLDIAQPDAPGLGKVAPVFQGANPDGTVVFFKDSQQLTEGASPSGSDLYRCEIPAGDPSGGCATLTNITAETQAAEESAQVLGLVAGMSDHGDALYFIARGVLDPAANEYGESAQAGEPNLYSWQEDKGVRFIASLSSVISSLPPHVVLNDEPNWGGQFAKSFGRSATTSPSGRYLAFMSERSLTEQANLDAESGKPVQEAFAYDAEADRLSCVSCSPLGAAPTGEVSKGFEQLVDQQSQWEGKRVAAILPQPSVLREQDATVYQPRAMLDNGRVFFNSLDSLVSLDSNHQWDVYEFEPFGVGDCGESSSGKMLVRAKDGCISLISSGTAEEEAAFLDASASGDDAFFLTSSRLSVLDKDSELDVYDARVNGVAATLTPSAECLGEACQPAAVVPSDPTPASAGFRGEGNQKQSTRKRCAKGKRKVRRGGKARCVARKQSKKGKAKRASQSRRAGR